MQQHNVTSFMQHKCTQSAKSINFKGMLHFHLTRLSFSENCYIYNTERRSITDIFYIYTNLGSATNVANTKITNYTV